jgi:hypothetical protein
VGPDADSVVAPQGHHQLDRRLVEVTLPIAFDERTPCRYENRPEESTTGQKLAASPSTTLVNARNYPNLGALHSCAVTEYRVKERKPAALPRFRAMLSDNFTADDVALRLSTAH